MHSCRQAAVSTPCPHVSHLPCHPVVHPSRASSPQEDPLLQELGLGQAGRVLCDRPKYRKNLLKIIRKMPYIGLFEKLRGMSKFEASGMTRWGLPQGAVEAASCQLLRMHSVLCVFTAPPQHGQCALRYHHPAPCSTSLLRHPY